MATKEQLKKLLDNAKTITRHRVMKKTVYEIIGDRYRFNILPDCGCITTGSGTKITVSEENRAQLKTALETRYANRKAHQPDINKETRTLDEMISQHETRNP